MYKGIPIGATELEASDPLIAGLQSPIFVKLTIPAVLGVVPANTQITAVGLAGGKD